MQMPIEAVLCRRPLRLCCADAHWEPEETLFVSLIRVSGPATLGLDCTTVHVVDEDTFPLGCPQECPPEEMLFWLINERLHHR